MKIRIENVSKIYPTKNGDVLALDDVFLELPEVGFICICGRNGSGKSSLLNCISLLDEEYTGNIYLNDTLLKTLPEKEKRSIRGNVFGYIFQKNNLITSLNAKENINIGKSLFKEDLKTEYFFEESFDLKKYPNQLSGGEQQKTAIHRALLQEKPIIVCDEPTASLDYQNTKSFIQALKEISKTRLVICVTHDREIVETNADRIIEMAEGKIIQDTVIHSLDETILETPIPSKRVSAKKLFVLSLGFFKRKKALSFAFGMIFILLLLVITILSAYAAFDTKSSLIKTLMDDELYSLAQDNNFYYNDKKMGIVATNTPSMVENCRKYLGEENFYYSINNGVLCLFSKNSGIPLGEGKIGTETLKELFDLNSLTGPIPFSMGSETVFDISINLTETFEGKGILMDYETGIKGMENRLRVTGGIWLNNESDFTMNNDFLGRHISYMPISYLNTLLEAPVTLEINEAIVTSDLKAYLDIASAENGYCTQYFLDFNSLDNPSALEALVDMNKIFNEGIKISTSRYLNSTDSSNPIYNSVVVSDEKYEQIKKATPFFDNISFYGKNQKENIASMVLECDYRFKGSLSLFSVILRHGQDVKEMLGGLAIAIAVLFVVLAFSAYILMYQILKYDATKIGILQCLGVSKNKAILSSGITVIVLNIVSLLLTWGIGFFVIDYLTSKQVFYLPKEVPILNYNYVPLLLDLLLVVFLILISFSYLFLSSRKKQIKDFFIFD